MRVYLFSKGCLDRQTLIVWLKDDLLQVEQIAYTVCMMCTGKLNWSRGEVATQSRQVDDDDDDDSYV